MKTAKDFQQREIFVEDKHITGLYVHVSTKPVRRAVTDKLRSMGFKAVQCDGEGWVLVRNLENFDRVALAKHINSWNDDEEWLASTEDQPPIADEDFGAACWQLMPGTVKGEVLRLVRLGRSYRARLYVASETKFDLDEAHWIVIHACSLLLKETLESGEKEVKSCGMTQEEWQASADAHNQEQWEKIPEGRKDHIDELLAAGGREQAVGAAYYSCGFNAGEEYLAEDAIDWRIKYGPRYITLDSQELNTVLAALRCWQSHRDGGPPWTSQWDDIATNNLETDMMSCSEIDALCERINGG